MHRHVMDRWADTTVFRGLLLFSAMAVLPVLLMGVTATLFGASVIIAGRADADLGPGSIAIALLSIGGSLGFLGYQRAHSGVKDPRIHDVTMTLVFLVAGVLAALCVAGFVLSLGVAGSLEPWGPEIWLIVLGALFAAANLVWAFSGIAWMQRLLRRYADAIGRPFDGVPVVFLVIAIALATAAVVTTAAL